MKNKNLLTSFKHAVDGIFSAILKERNMKIHFLMMALVIAFGLLFSLSIAEWITCILLFAFVIGAEMFNTAIEIAVDLAMPKIDEKAKLAKDISAGAVLIMAISAAIIGLIIFVPKIINFIN